LLESDVAYFEAGATIERLQGATIARMDGLESLAAGCVVQRIDPTFVPRNADGWLEDVEHRLSAGGHLQARLYLQREAPDLEAALIHRGYRSGDELAVMRPAGAAAKRVSAEVSLRPVENEEDWQEKHALHREMEIGPDGHPAPASLWVRMERRKCEAGYMKPYLILAGGKVVGAVNAAARQGILRLKNVVVAPNYRLQGIGSAAVGLLADSAAGLGKAATGAFVLADTPFLAMYTNAGFEVVSKQTEWVRELPAGPGGRAR
jgi:N-acetylglutamate synthase-like GNAT family acetyltransferase